MNKIKTRLITLATVVVGVTIAANSAFAATNYGIYVGETMVSSDNANDVLKNGQFSYNPSTKTLTVRNADLTNEGSMGSGISNREVDGLKILIEGNNTFNTRMTVINTRKSITISGT